MSFEGDPTHGAIHLFGNRLNSILPSKRLEVSDILGTPAFGHVRRPPSPGLKSGKSGTFPLAPPRPADLTVIMPIDPGSLA